MSLVVKASRTRVSRRPAPAPLLLSWALLLGVPPSLPAAEPDAAPAIEPAAVAEPDAPATDADAAPAEPDAVRAAADDAAAPAKTPAIDAAQLKAWFAELGHPAVSVRDEARTKLMGIGRADLQTLQGVVERARPLAPSQAAVLRQIVTHVYLASEPYDAIGRDGFLGVKMAAVAVATPPAERVDARARDAAAQGHIVVAPDGRGFIGGPADEEPALRAGIVIIERVPGFCGSRMLLDGDVILNTLEQPMPVLSLSEVSTLPFSTMVRETGAGQTIRFEVLRQGQIVRVAIPLDLRPIQADAATIVPFVNQRRDKADAYWEQTFKPLLQEGVG